MFNSTFFFFFSITATCFFFDSFSSSGKEYLILRPNNVYEPIFGVEFGNSTGPKISTFPLAIFATSSTTSFYSTGS